MRSVIFYVFYVSTADNNCRNKTIVRVLLFSFSGKRDPAFLMAPLLVSCCAIIHRSLLYDYSRTWILTILCFLPTSLKSVIQNLQVFLVIILINHDYSILFSDQTNLKHCNTNFLPRCQENAQMWKRLHQKRGSILDNEPVVLNSIPDTIEWVDKIKSDNVHVQLLVCGSLYLVAGVLTSLGYDTDSLLERKN